mgnify:CR=1 FL=1
MVPQFDNLDPDFTVTENLVVYGRYFGLKDSDIRARIPELLEFAASDPGAGIQRTLPIWEGNPLFTEHSYRSFSADASNQDLLLIQNIKFMIDDFITNFRMILISA